MINPTSRQFIVRVQGGLCNRMRTLASAIGFAERSNRRLKLCWEVTPYFQRFPLRDWRKWRCWRRFPADARFEASPKDLWENRFDEISVKEWQGLQAHEKAFISDFPPNPDSDAEILMLETCHDFFQGLDKSPIHYYNSLRLTQKLEARVNAELSCLRPGAPTFGIHIRSFAAHLETLNHSPLQWFIERIRYIRETIPDASIYIVTDSPSDSEHLHDLFPGILHEQSRTGGYNTRSAIRKALVDVHVLSRADYIVGSYFSSMSYLSATLQGGLGYEDAKRNWGTFPTNES